MLGPGQHAIEPANEADEVSDEELPEPEDGTELAQETAKAVDWIEWMKRATATVEAHMKKARVEDWTQGQKRRKWRLAGRALLATDGRWSQQVLNSDIEISF